VANFRETQLKHIEEGAPRKFICNSKVENSSREMSSVSRGRWFPEDGTSAIGLPSVPRNLDWVRLAQRFPVRIQVQNPDDSFSHRCFSGGDHYRPESFQTLKGRNETTANPSIRWLNLSRFWELFWREMSPTRTLAGRFAHHAGMPDLHRSNQWRFICNSRSS